MSLKDLSSVLRKHPGKYTYREIGQMIGVSPDYVRKAFRRLVAKGEVRSDAVNKREMRPVVKAPPLHAEKPAPLLKPTFTSKPQFGGGRRGGTYTKLM